MFTVHKAADSSTRHVWYSPSGSSLKWAVQVCRHSRLSALYSQLPAAITACQLCTPLGLGCSWPAQAQLISHAIDTCCGGLRIKSTC